MKLLRFALPLLLLSAASFAQANFQTRSDTFTFGSNTAITSWDGSDVNNPPYPGGMGAVSLFTSFGGTYGSAIMIPEAFWYLNNGHLDPCDPITFTPKQWIVGDGTHTGDQYRISGGANCPYFTGEYGTDFDSNNTYDSWYVVATFVRTVHPKTCRYGKCYTPTTDALAGGQGTTTQVVTQ